MIWPDVKSKFSMGAKSPSMAAPSKALISEAESAILALPSICFASTHSPTV